VRDLIEAGLSEPADAHATYGVSATTLVGSVSTWMIQGLGSSGCAAGFAAKVAVIAAAIASLGWLRSATAARGVDLKDAGQRGPSRSSSSLPQRCWV
jgi:hypothetical protein